MSKCQDFVDEIREELAINSNKLSYEFIEKIANEAKAEYSIVNGVTFCVLELPCGHKVTGEALVLDEDNFVEEIGKEVAFKEAKDKLWNVAGTIAKVLLEA